MAKPHYRTIRENKNGWSDWISPIHGKGKKNYRFACCDCGLVHEMQFRVRKTTNGRLDVIFRVSRNNRATAAKRRSKRSLH